MLISPRSLAFIHSFSANFFQAHQGGVRRDFHRGRPQVDESRRAGFRLVLVSMHDGSPLSGFLQIYRLEVQFHSSVAQNQFCRTKWLNGVKSCNLFAQLKNPLTTEQAVNVTKRSWTPTNHSTHCKQIRPTITQFREKTSLRVGRMWDKE